MEPFTVEEINLMCIYDIGTRAGLLPGLHAALPDVYEPELRALMRCVITRLETMTDAEFSDLVLVPDYAEMEDEYAE